MREPLREPDDRPRGVAHRPRPVVLQEHDAVEHDRVQLQPGVLRQRRAVGRERPGDRRPARRAISSVSGAPCRSLTRARSGTEPGKNARSASSDDAGRQAGVERLGPRRRSRAPAPGGPCRGRSARCGAPSSLSSTATAWPITCQRSRTPAPARTASRSVGKPIAARTSSATSGGQIGPAPEPLAQQVEPRQAVEQGGLPAVAGEAACRRSAGASAPRRGPGRRPSGGPGRPRGGPAFAPSEAKPWRTRSESQSERSSSPAATLALRAASRFARAARSTGVGPRSAFSLAFSAFFSRPSFHEATHGGGGPSASDAGPRGPDQHQAEGVLARELPARARAREGRAVGVDLRLVRLRAAPLALAPDQALARPQARPLLRRRQPLARLRRARVRGQGQDRLGGPTGLHTCARFDGSQGPRPRHSLSEPTNSFQGHRPAAPRFQRLSPLSQVGSRRRLGLPGICIH